MSIILRLAISLMWLTTIALVVVRTPRSSATLYRIQAWAEAVVAATLAIYTHLPWLWMSVGLVVLIKIGLIPRIIHRSLAHQSTPPYSGKGPLGMSSILMIAFVLTAAGLLLGERGLPHATLDGLLLAALFIAFLHLSSRYELWSLLWGLLSLDTVAGVAALVLPTHMPETIDVGIDTASLILALVLAYLITRIQRIKHSLDVRELEDLIG